MSNVLPNRLIAEDVLNTLKESALILTLDGHIEHANTAFLSLFKKRLAEVQNRRFWEIGDTHTNGTFKKIFDAVRFSPTSVLTNIEVSHDFRDDIGLLDLSLNARRFSDDRDDRQPEHIVIAMDDVTEERRFERENRRLRADADDASRQRNVLIRDVLAAATEGKLSLCLSADELPVPGEPCGEPIDLALPRLRETRMHVRECSDQLGITDTRADDLESAVGEAAMNAVLHGGGGIGQVYVARSDTPKIQVWIQDNGNGISVADLPRAILETGFSSKGTMGQGFRIILRTVDRLYMMTGPKGTTLILEQEKEAPLAPWLLSLGDGAF